VIHQRVAGIASGRAALPLFLAPMLLVGVTSSVVGCGDGGPAEIEVSDSDTVVVDGASLFWGADPAAHVWADGKLWVYPTRDSHDWDSLTGWDAWSTEDLRTWIRHPGIFEAEQCQWCTNNAWAPDAAYRNGQYYFYYYFRNDGGLPRGIGVAVSGNPEGPFENVTIERPLVDGHDPAVLIDDDGQAYLYTGHVIYFLNEDMTSLEMRGDGRPRDKIVEFRGHDPVGGWEGVWVFKREGRYYFTIADTDYRQLRYYMSDSPAGPFDYGGTLLHHVDGLNIHPSIVQWNGRWILFFHLWAESARGQRRVSAEFITFRPDGSIEPVSVTEHRISGRAPA
jgi:hypothetical protein